MEDQVKQLQDNGIRAVNRQTMTGAGLRRENTPSFSGHQNDRGRTMLCSDVCSRNLCTVAVHGKLRVNWILVFVCQFSF